jgi:hypothetical protein
MELKPGSERGFGCLFAAVFAVIGLFPLLDGEGPRWWSLGIGFGLLVIAWLRPALLAQPNYWWFRFGLALGKVMIPLTMGIVFFLAVLPTGLIMRLAGKDLLRLKFDPKAKSYWIEREEPLQSMKNQF